MKNNKGFSLVELIIVIAIMAILVGVMAPQLIKYIEKTNVSSDVQLCDTVREAVQTAMMDPSVINASNNGVPAAGSLLTDPAFTSGGTPFQDAVYEILGTNAPQNGFKSSAKNNSGQLKVAIGTNSVLVWITQSDDSGKKGTNDDPTANPPACAIHAGDTSLYSTCTTATTL